MRVLVILSIDRTTNAMTAMTVTWINPIVQTDSSTTYDVTPVTEVPLCTTLIDKLSLKWNVQENTATIQTFIYCLSN